MVNLDSMSKVFALPETQKRQVATFIVETIQQKEKVKPLTCIPEELLTGFLPASICALYTLSTVVEMLGPELWDAVQYETGNERYHEISAVVYTMKAVAIISYISQLKGFTDVQQQLIGDSAARGYLAGLDLKIEGINNEFMMYDVESVLALEDNNLGRAVAEYQAIAKERADNFNPVAKFTSDS